MLFFSFLSENPDDTLDARAEPMRER